MSDTMSKRERLAAERKAAESEAAAATAAAASETRTDDGSPKYEFGEDFFERLAATVAVAVKEAMVSEKEPAKSEPAKPDTAKKPDTAAKPDAGKKPDQTKKPDAGKKPEPAKPDTTRNSDPVRSTLVVSSGFTLGKAYKYWHKKRLYLTPDLWVAEQVAPRMWDVVYVWYEAGEIVRPLTDAELAENLPVFTGK